MRNWLFAVLRELFELNTIISLKNRIVGVSDFFESIYVSWRNYSLLTIIQLTLCIIVYLN